MNNNTFLTFFSKAIQTNNLEQRTVLAKFQRANLVPDNNATQKKISFPLFVCEIKIDKTLSLLVQDLPFNFLLAYTIFVGDKARLISFAIKTEHIHKKEQKTYIASEELYNKLLEQNNIEILEETKQEVKPRVLKNKEFEWGFKRSKLTEEVSEYISSVKPLNMNQIHIIPSKKVECFAPNTSAIQLKIAEKLSLPVISNVENSFIKDSHINIFDTIMQEKIIQPFAIFKEEINFDIDEKTGLKLYRDVTDNILLKVDFELISQKLYEAKCVNFDKNTFLNEITKIKHLNLVSRTGKIPLPLYKEYRGDFVEIKSEEDFLNITGTYFKPDPEFLKEIYIQGLDGKRATYIKSFLKEEYEEVFETLKETDEIIFSTTNELIIKLIHNKDTDIRQIVYKKAKENSEIDEITSLVRKTLRELILQCSQKGGSLRFNSNHDTLNLYFMKTYQTLNEISRKKFDKDIGGVSILRNLIFTMRDFICIIKNVEFKNDNLYFLAICTLELIEILSIFNHEASEQFKEEFYEYFKEFKTCIQKYVKEDLIEKTTLQISIANKLSQKQEVKVYLKKNFDVTFFKGPQVFSQEPTNIYINPNKKKLKYVFKYNKEEIYKIIKQTTLNKLETKQAKIEINNKTFPIKEDYYIIYRQFSGYKMAFDNPFFSVYIKNKTQPILNDL